MFQNRLRTINYERLRGLCLIGEYRRRLPVSLTRMIENAYDWEHLPFVHSSSFKSIKVVEQGDWGWRAVATLPDSRLQHLELLLDKSNDYWATTVLSGDARGFEIHTRATEVQEREIDIQVQFYLPRAFTKVLWVLNLSKALLPFSAYKGIAKKLGVHRVAENQSPKDSILKALQRQYSILYDEDETLMSGRQHAIDYRKQSAKKAMPETLLVGTAEELIKQLPKVVEFGKQRFVINRWEGEWRVYSAECPHLLGPLEQAEIDQDGQITCPWHGYKFDIATGKSCAQKTSSLAKPPSLSELDGYISLSST